MPGDTTLRSVAVQLLAPVLIGIGSAAVTVMVNAASLEARLVGVEQKARHHDEQIETLRTKSEDHAQRLARMDSAMEGVAASLAEIKGDVKILLRADR